MKSMLPNNRRASRVIINGLSRYSMRDVRRSVWACLIAISLCSGFISPAVSAKAPRRKAKAKVVKPTVTDIDVTKRVTSAATAKNTMPVSIDISGTGFGKKLTTASVKVTLFTNVESGEPIDATVIRAEDTDIFAHAELPVSGETSIQGKVGLRINDQSVDTNSVATDNYPFNLAVEKPPQPKPRSVVVDIKESNNPQTPTLHSVLLTPKDDSDTFAADPTDPKAMRVQILPPGATNVVIDPISNPDRALINFTAADGFKVQDVLVTVYDTGNDSGNDTGKTTDTRPKKTAVQQGDKEVKITNVDVVSLQRRDGFGRLIIEGSGFGNYGAIAGVGEIDLLCDSRYRTSQVLEISDTPEKRQQLTEQCKGYDTFKLPKDRSTNSSKPNNDGDSNAINASKAASSSGTGSAESWQHKIQTGLNVVILSRNPDFRVEQTKILYADDKVIDVYFEFSHWKGYSEPFRLESVSVSVTRDVPAAAPKSTPASGDETKAAHAKATPNPSPTPTPKPTTFLASFPIGPPKDKNLEYRYTVLDPDDASDLFGSGVGKNFYVLQLSVVNNSDKKLVVPLSSIQAEVEWSYNDEGYSEGGRTILFDEGPPTLSPLKLSAITSYFDTFQKTKGRRARLFNVLDGVGTLASAMVPVFGRGLERSNSILSGGFIPGLHKAFGDLSSQQLQNLTSMSWDSIEEIPAGGSKEKYVFVQRGDQVFESKSSDESSGGKSGKNKPKRKKKDVGIHKQIKSLQGLEVSGFIVDKSTSAGATQKQ